MNKIKEILHPEIREIYVFPTKAETAQAAAHRIIQTVNNRPTSEITYATGDTMIPVYQELAAGVRSGMTNFTSTQAYHLDEYYICGRHEEHGFVHFLDEYAFGPLHIPAENTHTLDGEAADGEQEARRYDALVSRGIAVAILGIGPGGHIGFNERNTPFDGRTHLALLSDETVHRDVVERGQKSPNRALTQGIATILEAQQLIMIAYGEKKGEYLQEALYGDISPVCPASALRLVGEKVSVFIDESAASRLRS